MQEVAKIAAQRSFPASQIPLETLQLINSSKDKELIVLLFSRERFTIFGGRLTARFALAETYVGSFRPRLTRGLLHSEPFVFFNNNFIVKENILTFHFAGPKPTL